MSNKKLLLVFFGIFIIGLVGLVGATVQANFNTYYSVINNNGSIDYTTTPLNGFAVDGYTCSNSACTTVGSPVPGLTSTTDKSYIIINFPTTQSQYGYILYFSKDGYIGMEGTGIKVSGSGTWVGPDIHLSKKNIGWAPIMNLNVVNEVSVNTPIEIDTNIGIDADTYSAIRDSRKSNVPINEFVKTLVTFEIINSSGNILYTKNKILNIEYSGAQHVSFNYSGFQDGQDGLYTFLVYTDVIDNKILKSVRQISSAKVNVLKKNSKSYWYTTISGLSMSPVFPGIGNTTSFNFNYISAYVDESGNSKSYDTKITTEFFRDSVWLYNNSYSLTNNSNQFVFNKTFNEAGNYNVVVSGLPMASNSTVINGVSESSQNISFIVDGAPHITCYSNLDCGYSYESTNPSYCSSGNVYHDFIFPSCISPGNVSSYCSYTNILPKLSIECLLGCSLGACIINSSVDDNVAPYSVSNLSIESIGGNWIFWKWINPPNEDFYLNIIFINGKNIINTSNNYYHLSGLNVDTNYKIEIFTMDNNSNINLTGVSNEAKTTSSHHNKNRESNGKNYNSNNNNFVSGNSEKNIKIGTISKKQNDFYSFWYIFALVLTVLIIILLIFILLIK